MSRLLNASCILAATALSIVSCSTMKQSNKSTPIAPEIEVDSILLEPVDSMLIAVEQEPLEDDDPTLLLDSLELDSVNADLFPQQEMYEDFHFEGSETSAVMIDEFRNTVVEDLEIILSDWDSHYPADGHVTSNFGWRKSRMHAGIDLKAQTGDNLYAAFDGVVRLAKYYSSYGYCVIIRHYNGLETLYAHASKLMVGVNDHVKAGDVIALAGNTGRSTGSHLHFEVRAGGNYFNPTLILDTDKRKIKDGNLYITMRNGKLFASNNDSEEEREAYILQQLSIRYHTVRSGDTLSRIAANNGTTVATICRLNGIKSTSILRIGQRLIVRDGIKPTAATSTTTATTATTTKSSTTTTNTSTTTYRVKKGDTLSTIAKQNGTTVSAICSLNGILANSTLQIGQSLRLRGTSAASSVSTSTTTASSSATGYHIVKSGDTLSAIAKRYGTTVSSICSLNGISANTTLQVGQRLQLNSSGASSTTATVPSTTSEEYHVVKSGDTLSAIAQRYGTTVSKICSLNGIRSTTTLQIKQRLRVR